MARFPQGIRAIRAIRALPYRGGPNRARIGQGEAPRRWPASGAVTTTRKEAVMETKSSRAPVVDSLIRISKEGNRRREGSLMSDVQQARSNERAIDAHGYTVGVV